MAFTNFQTYKVQAWGIIYLPTRPAPVSIILTAVSATYSLNGIPQCQIQVALGRDVVSGVVANIHEVLEELYVTVPIEIYAMVTPGPNSFGFEFETWPKQPFKVFMGRVTSFSGNRSRDSASINMTIDHWLCDLNFSSALTRTAHTITPQQLSGLAGFAPGQGIIPGFTSATMASTFFTPANVQADMWGFSLFPWLYKLTEKDLLAENRPGAVITNKEAQGALQRFEPFIYQAYRYGVPLQFPIGNAQGIAPLVTAISEDIASETFESVVSTTLWDKLIGIAANYRFAIVPLVETALVVPYCPGMRNWWTTIYGEEYELASPSMTFSRPFKGVRLFTGVGSATGALGFQQGQVGQEAGFGGEYINPDFPNGMMNYLNAPRWAANAVTPAAWGADAVAANGLRGNGIFPGVGVAPGNGNPGVIRNNMRPLWDAFAHSLYVAETLRGRRIQIQGKLRFDIAPGSTVRIQMVQDRFIEGQIGVKPGSILYGEVSQLTFNINSEAMSASTTFAIDNVRNTVEQAKDATSVDAHPLYSVIPWIGAPLSEQAEFVPPQVNRAFKF